MGNRFHSVTTTLRRAHIPHVLVEALQGREVFESEDWLKARVGDRNRVSKLRKTSYDIPEEAVSKQRTVLIVGQAPRV